MWKSIDKPTLREDTKWCFGHGTQSHGGREGLNLFHFSENAQAARKKSLEERIPSQGIMSLTASFTFMPTQKDFLWSSGHELS